MYAIIENGGKQYQAEQGRWLDLELLHSEEGSTVEFPALMVVDGDNVHVGTPHVQATVSGKVLKEEIKGKKMVSFKYRAQKRLPAQTRPPPAVYPRNDRRDSSGIRRHKSNGT